MFNHHKMHKNITSHAEIHY